MDPEADLAKLSEVVELAGPVHPPHRWLGAGVHWLSEINTPAAPKPHR
jgi:hypothetical protein